MTMHTTTRGLAVAATVLGLALAGCGSDTKTDTAGKESTSSTSATSTTSEASSTSAAPSSTANASGQNYTIMDYVKDNKIAETPVKRGDPGTPTVNLPIPEAGPMPGPRRRTGHGGRLCSPVRRPGRSPPDDHAIMSKLTGADPAKIIEYAPNELKNLPSTRRQRRSNGQARRLRCGAGRRYVRQRRPEVVDRPEDGAHPGGPRFVRPATQRPGFRGRHGSVDGCHHSH